MTYFPTRKPDAELPGLSVDAPTVSTTLAISGSAGVGQVLTAAPGTMRGIPAPTALWRWQRNDGPSGAWQDISGATSSTYTLVSADVGYSVRAGQAGSNVAGVSAYRYGSATGSVSSDVTAPIITSPAAGTFSGGVQPVTFGLDEGGTLYWIAETASQISTITAAQIEAGNNASDTAAPASGSGAVSAGTPTLNTALSSGLSGSYFIAFFVKDAAGNRSTPAEIGPVTLDTTAPVLSLPVDTSTGSTTASWSVTSNEAGGTIFAAARLSTSPVLSTSEIEGGGGNAIAIDTDVSPTADAANAGSFATLTASTAYVVDMFQRDAYGNESAVVSGSGFTTSAASGSAFNLIGTLEQTSNSTGGTAMTLTPPTAGNLLVLFHTTRQDKSPALTPSGWTLLGSEAGYSTSLNNIAVFTKTASGSETSVTLDHTTGSSDYNAICLEVSGGLGALSFTGDGNTTFSTDLDVNGIAVAAGDYTIEIASANAGDWTTVPASDFLTVNLSAIGMGMALIIHGPHSAGTSPNQVFTADQTQRHTGAVVALR